MKLLYLGHFDDLRDLKEIKEKKKERKGDRHIDSGNRDNVL